MCDGICEHYYHAIAQFGYVDRSSPWKTDLRKAVRMRAKRVPLVQSLLLIASAALQSQVTTSAHAGAEAQVLNVAFRAGQSRCRYGRGLVS